MITFEKYVACGNDFIFINSKELESFESLGSFRLWIKNLCHRNFGIGADGVVILSSNSFDALIVNADGSFAATCGNALRCIGLAFAKKKVWKGSHPIDVSRLQLPENLAGQLLQDELFVRKQEIFATLLSCDLEKNEVVISMPQEIDIKEIIFKKSHQIFPSTISALFIELSNPHLVLLDNNHAFSSKENKELFGKWAQTEGKLHANFPIPICNIGFLTFENRKWKLQVYERGAGLTLACGSGAIAAHVALEHYHLVPQDKSFILNLEFPGGIIHTGYKKVDLEYVRTLGGQALHIFSGSLRRPDFGT